MPRRAARLAAVRVTAVFSPAAAYQPSASALTPTYAPTYTAPSGAAINGASPLSGSTALAVPQTPGIFGSLERAIAATFNGNQPGQRLDWQELEGCYVLRPPSGRAPEAVVHFLGGAFVGAAPQLSYRCALRRALRRARSARRRPPAHRLPGTSRLHPPAPARAAAHPPSPQPPLRTPPNPPPRPAACSWRRWPTATCSSSPRPTPPAWTTCASRTRRSSSSTARCAR